MPTYEELEAQLAQAIAARDLLSNELSNQAEQFSKWRGAVSAIAGHALDGTRSAEARIGCIAFHVGAICGV